MERLEEKSNSLESPNEIGDWKDLRLSEKISVGFYIGLFSWVPVACLYEFGDKVYNLIAK